MGDMPHPDNCRLGLMLIDAERNRVRAMLPNHSIDAAFARRMSDAVKSVLPPATFALLGVGIERTDMEVAELLAPVSIRGTAEYHRQEKRAHG
jgi:hypothetical protein